MESCFSHMASHVCIGVIMTDVEESTQNYGFMLPYNQFSNCNSMNSMTGKLLKVLKMDLIEVNLPLLSFILNATK